MMKFLLLTLTFAAFYPNFLLARGEAPDCAELKSIVNDLDKSIQNKNLAKESCDTLSIKDILPEGKSGDAGAAILKDMGCQNLSVIDLRLKKIESELALLVGIEKLKSDVKNEFEKTKSDDSSKAQEALANFENDLNIAQSLELVLNTEGKFLPILSQIKAEELDTPEKFKAKAQHICKNLNRKPDAIDVCSPQFMPDQAAIDEILSFIEVGKNGTFNPGHIKDLKEAIVITKADGSPYSFTEMRGMVDRGEGSLKDKLKVVTKLPDFQNDKAQGFIERLKDSKKNMLSKFERERFQSLVDDLIRRQEWEMKSKFALVQHEYITDKTKESTYSTCEGAKENKAKFSECLSLISKEQATSGSGKAQLKKLSQEFEHTENYLDELRKTQADCSTSTSGILSNECLQAMEQLNKNQARLLEEAKVLGALREKLSADTSETMTLRNFTVDKLSAAGCFESEMDLNVGDCYESFEGLPSPEAIGLVGSGLDIVLVLSDAEENSTDISEICSDDSIAIKHKDRLCSSEADAVRESKKKSEKEATKPAAPETLTLKELGQLAPSNTANDSMKRPLLDAATMLAKSAAQLFVRPPPPVNPYGYYSMGPTGSGGLSISDSIIRDARRGGYGMYFSSPPSPYTPYK